MRPAARARRYVRDITSGKRTSCRYVKAACERQLRDLERVGSDKFPYHYDEAAADTAVNFIELLPHTKGRWAASGDTITLSDWQCFIVCTIFGWQKDAGGRRFREAYCEIPRKNGKSTLAAGIGNYCFTADGEFGAEVYCGATSEKQAWEVFRPARLQASRCVPFREYYGILVMAKSMAIMEDGSRFEPLIGDPGDGSSPSCAIVDEYHEHPNEALYDTMKTGMGAREQPLMFIITTAGSNTGGPCYEKRDEVTKILDGTFSDSDTETIFGVIYTLDEEDLETWSHVRSLKKANPNYGVSVSAEYLKGQVSAARRTPSKQNTCKTKHLNIWTGAASAWLNMVHWNKCRDRSLRIEDFRNQTWFFGLDLASKFDFTSFMQVTSRIEDDGLRHWYWFGSHFLPEDTIADSKMQRRLEGWVEQGYIQRTEGAETSFDDIKDTVLDLAGDYQAEEIVYDPWRATQLAHQLEDEGATVVQMHSTRQNMNPPMRELEAAIATGRFHHDGNPCLTWMASNVIAKEVRGALQPDKEAADKKIDGIVAGLMAMNRAILSDVGPSVYETRGIRTL